MKQYFKENNIKVIYCRTEKFMDVCREGQILLKKDENGALNWYSELWDVWLIQLNEFNSILIPVKQF